MYNVSTIANVCKQKKNVWFGLYFFCVMLNLMKIVFPKHFIVIVVVVVVVGSYSKQV